MSRGRRASFPIGADSPRVIHATHVAGRRVIYLDTSVWSVLGGPSNGGLLGSCSELVASGRAIFPVSWPSVFETLRDPEEERRTRQARVMDRLSRCVSLRQTLVVEREEVHGALPAVLAGTGVPPTNERVFTHLIECLGDGHIQFSEEWTNEATRLFMEKLSGAIQGFGVERLAGGMDLCTLRTWHKRETDRRLAESRGASSARRNAARFRRKDGRLNYGRILEEERVYFYRRARDRLLTYMLATLPVSEAREALHGTSERNLGIDGFFGLMPSIALRAEIFAQRVLSFDRHERPGDLFDNEHASVAPAYCDAFATRDSNLASLVRACSVPRERGCRVLLDTQELEGYLAELRCGPPPESECRH